METTSTKGKPPKGSDASSTANGVEVETLSVESDDKEIKPPPVIVATTQGAGRATETPERRALERAEDQTINDYVLGLRGNGPLKISINRIKPKLHMGKKVDGHLDTVEDMITEEEIRENYGGGDYSLIIKRKNKQGSWVYYTSTTCSVAGDPRVDNLPSAAPTAPAAPVEREQHADPLVGRAFDFFAKQAEERNSNRGGDGASRMAELEVLLKPMQMQIATLTAQLAAKDQQLADAHKAPANPFQEKLLDNLMKDDSARVAAVRDQLLSELRVVKEHARADEERLKDRHDRMIADIEKRHDRQIADIKASHEREINMMKGSGDISGTVKDGEIRRLTAELADVRGDLKELRARKEQTIGEKVKEVQALAEVVGGDKEDGDESKLGQLASAVLASPLANRIASRFMGPDGQPLQQQPQQQQVQQAPPQRQAPRLRRGQVIRNRGTGKTFMQTDEGLKEVSRQPQEQGQRPVEVQIPQADLDNALLLLENAFRNQMDPKTVATTARTAVPQAIMTALADHLRANPERGVDEFLTKVAKLPSTSPLATQAGRNWTREVGQALVGQ